MKQRAATILVSVVLALVGIFAWHTPAAAMSQIIIGGHSDALSKLATEYNDLGGGSLWTATATQRLQVVPTGGSFTNFQVELSASPAEAGRSYTITLMVNGNPSALAVTITGNSATTGVDTDTVDVTAGDYVYLQSTYSATAPSNTPSARWSIKFTGTTANESIILGTGVTNRLGARYAPIMAGYPNSSSTESWTYQVIPTGGSIKKLYVVLDIDPGNSPDDFYFRLREGGGDSDDGSGNPLSVTIAADNTAGNDTTHTIAVSAGNYVDFAMVPENVPASSPYAGWGMVFLATTDGESVLLGQSSDAPTNSQTEYNYLVSARSNESWGTTENKQGGQANTSNAILKNLYIKLASAPGASPDAWTFTVRKTGPGSTDITVTITGAATTTGSDTAHTYTMADYDDLALMAVPADAPTADMLGWGLVCYIAPPAPEVSNTPSSKAWGIVNLGDSTNTSINLFTITNIGTGAAKVTIQGTDLTGGDDTWDLSDDATNGSNIYGLKAGLDDADDLFDITIQEASAVTLVASLAEDATQGWGLWILMPSAVTGYNNQQMTATLTLVVSSP